MIANTTYRAIFSKTINYVFRDELNEKTGERKAPELLDKNGIIILNNREIAAQFQRVSDVRTRLEKPVWHTSLSFQVHEKISNEMMVTIAKEYMQRMGANPEKHQYIIVRHNDTEHPHIHLVINRVGMDGGAAIRRDNDRYRQKDICAQLDIKYGLAITSRRQNDKVIKKKAKGLNDFFDKTRAAVLQALEKATTHEKFKLLLQEKNIEVQYRENKNGIYGASFRYKDISIKGSDIGTKWNMIKQRLEENALALNKVNKQKLITELKIHSMDNKNIGGIVGSQKTIEPTKKDQLSELSQEEKAKKLTQLEALKRTRTRFPDVEKVKEKIKTEYRDLDNEWELER